MLLVGDVDLEPGKTYTSAEIEDAFGGKGRSGQGIQISNDDNGQRFIRLFSTPHSEYGDDLDADLMRYVGHKNFEDETKDQQPKYGNGALIESQENPIPIFLFEKRDSNSTDYYFHGRVRVVRVEKNYRPQKRIREYDFYLECEDGFEGTNKIRQKESDDDLAPGQLSEITPDIRDMPDQEEEIAYQSQKRTQTKANNKHEEMVVLLSDQLSEWDFGCKKTQYTDVIGTSDDHVVAVEVKSLSESNERKQIRSAIGQLLENSYRDIDRRGWHDREQTLCLAFSSPPSDEFSGYLEYLRKREIGSLWIDGDVVSGHPEIVKKLKE